MEQLRSQRRFVMEALEPRVLLNGDTLGIPVDRPGGAVDGMGGAISAEVWVGALPEASEDVPANELFGDISQLESLSAALDEVTVDQIAEALPASFGATIITHGFQLPGADGNSLRPMAESILDRFEPGSAWLLDHNASDNGFQVFERSASGGFHSLSSLAGGTVREVVFLFDWAGESAQLSSGWAEAAGEKLFNLLNRLGIVQKAGFHFIGHSFGTVVTSEAVERVISLGGKTVDHVTYLDPHDFVQGLVVDQAQELSGLGQPAGYGATVWEGVNFTDVYYQTVTAPDGRAIPGAYNVDVSSLIPASHLLTAHSYVWEEIYLETIKSENSSDDLRGYGWSSVAAPDARDQRPTPRFYSQRGHFLGHEHTDPSLLTLDGSARERIELLKAHPTVDPLSVTNGNFELIGSPVQKLVPGWSSPSRIAGLNDLHYLSLSGDVTKASRLAFLPPQASYLVFDYEIAKEGTERELTVSIDGKRELVEGPRSAEWRTHFIPLPAARGQSVELSFEALGGAHVNIDNVRFQGAIDQEDLGSLNNALEELPAWFRAVEAFDKLGLKIPLFDQSLGELVQAAQQVASVVGTVQEALAQQPVNIVSLPADGLPLGAYGRLHWEGDAKRLRISIDFTSHPRSTVTGVDLGSPVGESIAFPTAKFELVTSLAVKMEVAYDLSKQRSGKDAFSATLINAEVKIKGTLVPNQTLAPLELGFFELESKPVGTLELNASATSASAVNHSLYNPGGFVVAVSSPRGNHLELDLGLAFRDADKLGLGALDIRVSDSDIFDITNPVWTFAAPGWNQLKAFGDVTADGLLLQVQTFVAALSESASSRFMSQAIPFLDESGGAATLGSKLNLAAVLADKYLDPFLSYINGASGSGTPRAFTLQALAAFWPNAKLNGDILALPFQTDAEFSESSALALETVIGDLNGIDVSGTLRLQTKYSVSGVFNIDGNPIGSSLPNSASEIYLDELHDGAGVFIEPDLPHHLTITTAGQTHFVDLSNCWTVQSVVDRINSQHAGLSASYDTSAERFILSSVLADIKVSAYSNQQKTSLAPVTLGLVGSFEQTDSDLWVMQGAPLHGDSAVKHVRVGDLALNGSIVATVDNAGGSAALGPVALRLEEGAGSARLEFSLGWADPIELPEIPQFFSELSGADVAKALQGSAASLEFAVQWSLWDKSIPGDGVRLVIDWPAVYDPRSLTATVTPNVGHVLKALSNQADATLFQAVAGAVGRLVQSDTVMASKIPLVDKTPAELLGLTALLEGGKLSEKLAHLSWTVESDTLLLHCRFEVADSRENEHVALSLSELLKGIELPLQSSVEGTVSWSGKFALDLHLSLQQGADGQVKFLTSRESTIALEFKARLEGSGRVSLGNTLREEVGVNLSLDADADGVSVSPARYVVQLGQGQTFRIDATPSTVLGSGITGGAYASIWTKEGNQRLKTLISYRDTFEDAENAQINSEGLDTFDIADIDTEEMASAAFEATKSYLLMALRREVGKIRIPLLASLFTVDQVVEQFEDVFTRSGLDVKGSATKTTSTRVAFDLGIPALLKFESEADFNITFKAAWELGIKVEHGLVEILPIAGHELVIEISAAFVGNVSAELGGLLSLQLTSADDQGLRAALTLGIDLNPGNAANNSFSLAKLSQRLTGSGIEVGGFIDAQFHGVAELRKATPGTLPGISSDLRLRWGFGSAVEPSTRAMVGANLVAYPAAPEVAFNNVTLHLGEFLSRVVGPILGKISELTKPIQPLVDFLTSRLPVLSDLAGGNVNLLDLAEFFGADVRSVRTYANVINAINNYAKGISALSNAGPTSSGSVGLLMGSFKVGGDQLLLKGIAGGLTLTSLDAYTDHRGGDVMDAVGGINGELPVISFPILDPASVFKLLIGQDVDLVRVDLPTFDWRFTYSQFFPIFAILGVQVEGAVGASLDLDFGYDTRGLRDAVRNKNALEILDGLYISDVDANNRDVAEFRLYAGISAFAAIDVAVASAGVGGGILAEVGFNLHDPNGDGKVYFDEFWRYLTRDPLHVFDVSGKVTAGLSAYVKVLFYKKTFNIAEVTLFDFDIPRPGLGTGGEPQFPFDALSAINLSDAHPDVFLRINENGEIDVATDSEFSNRKSFAPSDIYITSRPGGSRIEIAGSVVPNNAPDVVVSGLGGRDTILVAWGDQVNINAGGGDDVIEIRSGGRDLFVQGGGGSDRIDIDAPGSHGKVFGDDAEAAVGAPGNDVISVVHHSGLIQVFGGGGNDTIKGSEGVQLIHGGPGSDNVFANGAKESHGDGDNDRISSVDSGHVDYSRLSGIGAILRGGEGDDVLSGSAGGDALWGGAGADTLVGKDGADFLNGEGDDDSIEGGNGDDVLHGGDGTDTLDGGSDSDRIYGEGGTDFLFGGSGSDLVVGGGGGDELEGGSGDDRLFGHYDFSQREADRGDDDSNSILGNIGNDLLVGGPDDDTLNGGSGNDVLVGKSGDDTLIGAAGNDFIFGGSGLDRAFGRSSETDTGNSTELNWIFGDWLDDLSAEAWIAISNGATESLASVPIEQHQLTGSDTLYGSPGNDIIRAGAGGDLINGLAGNDHLDGQAGDDRIYGGLGSDTIVGGHGRDQIYSGTERKGQDLSPNYLYTGLVDFSAAELIDDAEASNSGSHNFATGDSGKDFIYGGSFNDNLEGGEGADFIVAGSGMDKVLGNGGDDILDGGDGDDLVQGGSGSDTLIGGWGHDHLHANTVESTATIDGGHIYGDLQDLDERSIATGVNANDSIYGDAGSDRIYGGPGNDRMDSYEGSDQIFGQGGDDVAMGHDGEDSIDGGSGDDWIHGGDGSDAVSGGLGHDHLFGDSGTDTLDGGEGADFLFGGATGQTDTQRQTLRGGDGADSLFAFGEIGETGRGDVLFGEGGDDFLYGNTRDDELHGGTGNDYLHGDYLAGGLYIRTLDSYPLNARRGGAESKDKLWGDAGQDQVLGGRGDDWISGGAGGDWLDGQDGTDKMLGGAPSDVGGASLDDDSVDFFLYDKEVTEEHSPGKADILLIEGDQDAERNDSILVTASLLEVTVIYNGTSRVMPWNTGKGGQIQVNALMGNDLVEIRLKEADERVLALFGHGRWAAQIDGGPGNDVLKGTHAADRLDGGPGSDFILGNEGDDRVYGDSRDGISEDIDVLFGGAGDDDLIGGVGQNFLLSWAGGSFLGAEPIKDWRALLNSTREAPDNLASLPAKLLLYARSTKNTAPTGINRMLGSTGSQPDYLFGGFNGMDLLYGNGGGGERGDVYIDGKGQVFKSEFASGDLQWKEFAKKSDRIWYISGSEAADTITVNYDTNRNVHFIMSGQQGSQALSFHLGRDFTVRAGASEQAIHSNSDSRFSSSMTADYSEASPTGSVHALNNPLALDLGRDYFGTEAFLGILVDALGGDDMVTVSPTVQKSVWIDAGDGADKVEIQNQVAFLRDTAEGSSGNDTMAHAHDLGLLDGSVALKGLTHHTISAGSGQPDVDYFRFETNVSTLNENSSIEITSTSGKSGTKPEFDVFVQAGPNQQLHQVFSKVDGITKWTTALDFVRSLSTGLLTIVIKTSSGYTTQAYELDIQIGSRPSGSTVSERSFEYDSLRRRDVVFGGSGDDVLIGGAFDEWLFGGDDDDILAGGLDFGAEDLVIGGRGNDTFLLWPDGARLNGPDGADDLQGGEGSDQVMFLGRSDGNEIVSFSFDRNNRKHKLSNWLRKDTSDVLSTGDAGYLALDTFFHATGIESTRVILRQESISAAKGPSTWLINSNISRGDIAAGAEAYQRFVVFGSNGDDGIALGDTENVVYAGYGRDQIRYGNGNDIVFDPDAAALAIEIPSLSALPETTPDLTGSSALTSDAVDLIKRLKYLEAGRVEDLLQLAGHEGFDRLTEAVRSATASLPQDIVLTAIGDLNQDNVDDFLVESATTGIPHGWIYGPIPEVFLRNPAAYMLSETSPVATVWTDGKWMENQIPSGLKIASTASMVTRGVRTLGGAALGYRTTEQSVQLYKVGISVEPLGELAIEGFKGNVHLISGALAPEVKVLLDWGGQTGTVAGYVYTQTSTGWVLEASFPRTGQTRTELMPAGDLNADGYSELIRRDANNATLLESNNKEWKPAASQLNLSLWGVGDFGGPNSGYLVQTVTSDGLAGRLYRYEHGSEAFTVFENPGRVTDVRRGDFDGDFLPDLLLIVAKVIPGVGVESTLHYIRGRETFSSDSPARPEELLKTDKAMTFAPEAASDLNGDHIADVQVVVGEGDGRTSLFLLGSPAMRDEVMAGVYNAVPLSNHSAMGQFLIDSTQHSFTQTIDPANNWYRFRTLGEGADLSRRIMLQTLTGDHDILAYPGPLPRLVATFNLYTGNGKRLAEGVTSFSMFGLPAGEYYVEISTPAGFSARIVIDAPKIGDALAQVSRTIVYREGIWTLGPEVSPSRGAANNVIPVDYWSANVEESREIALRIARNIGLTKTLSHGTEELVRPLRNADLLRVTHLDLSGLTLSAGVKTSGLESLTAVSRLDLTNANIPDLGKFPVWPLTTLVANSTKVNGQSISDIAFASRWSTLESLGLRGQAFENPPALSGLNALTSLDLSGNPGIFRVLEDKDGSGSQSPGDQPPEGLNIRIGQQTFSMDRFGHIHLPENVALSNPELMPVIAFPGGPVVRRYMVVDPITPWDVPSLLVRRLVGFNGSNDMPQFEYLTERQISSVRLLDAADSAFIDSVPAGDLTSLHQIIGSHRQNDVVVVFDFLSGNSDAFLVTAKAPDFKLSAPLAALAGVPVQIEATAHGPSGGSLSYTIRKGETLIGTLNGTRRFDHTFSVPGRYTIEAELLSSSGSILATAPAISVQVFAIDISAGGLTEGVHGRLSYSITKPESGIDQGSDSHAVRIYRPSGKVVSDAQIEAQRDATTGTLRFVPDESGLYKLVLSPMEGISLEKDFPVANVSPHIEVEPLPLQATEGDSVTFKARAVDVSSDRVLWNWIISGASGSGFEELRGEHSDRDLSLTFAPPDDGLYSLILRAVDHEGAVSSRTTQIIVANSAPVIAGLTVSSAAGGSGSIVEGASAFLSVDFGDRGVNDALTARIWWDDGVGSPEEHAIEPGTRNLVVEHTFSRSATVRVQLSDPKSSSTEGRLSVSVANARPGAPTIAIQNGVSQGDEFHFQLAGADFGSANGADLTFNSRVLRGDTLLATSAGRDVHFVPELAGDYRVETIASDAHGAVSEVSTLHFTARPAVPKNGRVAVVFNQLTLTARITGSFEYPTGAPVPAAHLEARPGVLSDLTLERLTGPNAALFSFSIEVDSKTLAKLVIHVGESELDHTPTLARLVDLDFNGTVSELDLFAAWKKLPTAVSPIKAALLHKAVEPAAKMAGLATGPNSGSLISVPAKELRAMPAGALFASHTGLLAEQLLNARPAACLFSGVDNDTDAVWVGDSAASASSPIETFPVRPADRFRVLPRTGPGAIEPGSPTPYWKVL